MHEYRDEELSTALGELPIPPRSHDFVARVSAESVRARRRSQLMPRRPLLATMALVGLALLVGGFVGSKLAPSTAAATSALPAFTPTAGWNTVETNNREEGVNSLDLAWAANVPFASDDTQNDWPMATLQSLPSNGIVIVVTGPFAFSGDESPPELQAPVRVEDMSFHDNNYETQPAPDVSYYLTSARINATEVVNVNVWMGTNDPSPDMEAAADQELSRLVLPSS